MLRGATHSVASHLTPETLSSIQSKLEVVKKTKTQPLADLYDSALNEVLALLEPPFRKYVVPSTLFKHYLQTRKPPPPL